VLQLFVEIAKSNRNEKLAPLYLAVTPRHSATAGLGSIVENLL